MVEFFKGLSFFFLPLGFGPKRIDFFEKQIRKFGGNLDEDKSKITHVVIEESTCEKKGNCSSALRSRGFCFSREKVKYVRVTWLSECLSRKILIDTKPYELKWIEEEFLSDDVEGEEKRKRQSVIEDVYDDSLEKRQKVDYEKYACSMPSSSIQGETSQRNKLIVEELDKLANAYALRKDTWRSHGYRKAINAIIMYDKEITTFQQACMIPGVSEKMALKIVEIIEFGKLGKVDEIVDEKTKILDVFCKVWGVGPSTAEAWHAQGFRNLEDLRDKAKLTRQQEIGLMLYDDFQKRIPRNEVVEIYEIVKKGVNKIQGSLKVELVGSFRRGKAHCGDVDLMIVNHGPRNPGEILIQLTDALRGQGYLTNDLINLDTAEEENHHRKYMGVFKMPGKNQIHRRLDLFVVPKSEYAAALVHYTGSALFNRSIKLLAAKKNMTLTEHGLYADTLRMDSKVTSRGRLITTVTEEDIFKELGLPYKLPEERDH